MRNGSRGMLWLEPLVEVEIDGVRHGFGPLAVGEVEGLIAAVAAGTAGGIRGRSAGRGDPLLRGADALSFARCGVTDPLSLDDYAAHGGWKGLARTIEIGPEATVAEVTASGLRGRGGAGFPTGIKWKTVADTPGAEIYRLQRRRGRQRYLRRQDDDGGRSLLMIEGMAIAGIAVGAERGYIYIRSEYPHATAALEEAIAAAVGRGCSGRGSADRGMSSGWKCGWGPGPMSAARKPRCSTAWRAGAGCAGGAAAPGSCRAVRAADGDQQCAVACGRALHCRGTGQGLPTSAWGARADHADQLAGNIRHGGLYETAFGVTLGELVRRSAAAPRAGGRCGRCRSGGRSGPTFRRRCSTRRSTTRPSRRGTG